MQNLPAVLLGIGMIIFPETPRWLLMAGQDERALRSLSRLRKLSTDDLRISQELLAYRVEVLFEQSYAERRFPGKSGITLAACQYYDLVSSWSKFKRLAIGCLIMFFQQFIGCNAIIYYAPTVFTTLGLSDNTTSTSYRSIRNCEYHLNHSSTHFDRQGRTSQASHVGSHWNDDVPHRCRRYHRRLRIFSCFPQSCWLGRCCFRAHLRCQFLLLVRAYRLGSAFGNLQSRQPL